MAANILYIGAQPGEDWVAEIKTRLKEEVEFQVVPEEDAELALAYHHYPVILIDSGSVDDVAALIYTLRGIQPEANIIVLTAAPTWNRARQAYHAGAKDYLSKLLNKDQLAEDINNLLKILPLLTAVFPLLPLSR